MNAIGYTRLSSKDQSKSLEYQESTIRDYCRRNGLDVLDIFTDNGKSSYTFDRPDYLALEAYLKKIKGKCQFLIVLDHDRFSRNLPEALMKIAELEKKYGVKVLSTNERVDLDTSDPDVFMKRALDYMIANKELFNIRKRTKQGVRNAKEKGRYLGRAPFGYRNIIDGTKKNLIEIYQPEAIVVERIFQEYLLGIPQYIVYKNAKAAGLKHTGSNAINDILRNWVYAGLIRVPALGELPEKYVKSIHSPIISEAEYWQVQDMLTTKKRRKREQPAEDFPLRGVLKCWCGEKMTAGWTKGAQKYYLYYRCMDHTNVNIPGATIHDTFAEVLRGLSLRKHQTRYILEASKEMLKEPIRMKNERHAQKLKELREINKKIYKLEERMVNDEIEATTYQTWFKKLQNEKRMIEAVLNGDEKPRIKSDKDIVARMLPRLENLFLLYDKGNVTQKHTLIRGLFKDSLLWGHGSFRTKYLDRTFHDNLLKVNKKGLLFNEQPFKNLNKNLVSTQEEIRTPTPIQAPAPQAGASTNFATWVCAANII